jgi:hypothetical protein
VSAFWRFLRDKSNREVLAWVGGGVVTLAAAAWTVFVYLWPINGSESTKAMAPAVEAKCGGVAIGGNVSGSTITGGTARQSNC